MPIMNSVCYDENGPAQDVLGVRQIELPKPGKGQVRVRMVLSPIHNHDIITVTGGYGISPSLPAQAGSEALGVVDAIGEGVSGLSRGDRVIAAGLSGTWSDYYLGNAARLVRVPDDLPDDLAAQLAGMPFDAFLAFNAIAAKPGEWMIVNAANGAVGKAILQIGRARRVNAIALVHSEERKRDLVEGGFANVFVSTDKGWSDAASGVIGGARLVGGLDMVGGALVADMMKLFSPGATMLVLGSLSNEPLQLQAGPVIFGELTLKGFWAGKAASRLEPAQINAVIGEVIKLAQEGQFELPVAATYPLSKIRDAVVATSKSRNGKILLKRG